jgi:hypothetical protein
MFYPGKPVMEVGSSDFPNVRTVMIPFGEGPVWDRWYAVLTVLPFLTPFSLKLDVFEVTLEPEAMICDLKHERIGI